MEKLIHYSDKPLGRLYSVTGQKGSFVAVDNKPSGLWVSVGASWKRTAKECGWKWARVDLATVFRLKRGAKILRLGCSIEMYAFTEEYGVESPLAREYPGLFTSPVIDWQRVASEYQGIVITPYLWECRMDHFTQWYYTWDCASGCIWDVDAIEAMQEKSKRFAKSARLV